MDVIAYHYRPYTGSTPEVCDAPRCERPATIEIVDDPHLFCSTECADRTL